LSISENSPHLQTLFKLHLRTSQQARESAIYREWFSGEHIKKLIIDFKRCAQQALFFVPIRRIKALYPGQRYQESWEVEKLTEDLPGFSGTMGIRYHHSSLEPKLERWSVLFKTIPPQDIPPHFKECLSTNKIQTISIGIAGALDKPPPDHQPPHRPFFGLPLMRTISLPIHLHCTFILSEDRRSIRYDEKGEGNPESKFNKWLLTEMVPSLYLQFLAGWSQNHPMRKCPWWPNGAETDIISQVVVKAMEKAFPISDELVCNTYSGQRIAPSRAHFLQPPCPEGLLKALLPEDLAITPRVFSYLPSPPLQSVDSDYLTTLLRREAASIISMYKGHRIAVGKGGITVGDVVNVARFLKPSSLPNSIGLPLLPLADGTLAPLSAEHTTFYCPQRQHETPWLPFPPHHFLDPKAAEDRTIYDSLQVRELDTAAISRLITAKIPEQDTFSSSPALEKWLKELWKLLNKIPVAIEDPAFLRLPLIPTYGPTETPTRISFQKLTESDVLFIDTQLTGVPLDACVALGIRVIRASDCKKKLRESIKSRKEQLSGIRRTIIRFFSDLPFGQISHHFQGVDHELHSEFSQWFRGGLSYRSLTSAEQRVVQDIPLWETVQIGLAPAKFVSARTALMIPEGVSPNVVQTWTTGSTEYVPADDLLSLMKKPVTLPTFYTNHLSFPLVMNTVTSTYKSLLRRVLDSSDPRPSILVPNANGRMSSSKELYLSSNATFAASFASQNKVFLHPDLRDLEQQLGNWGLINTITTTSFKACALGIHQGVGGANLSARARTVFRTYNTKMPSKLLGDYFAQEALRMLRFIPRHTGSTRYGSIPTDRYHSLPNIVSPSEIVDPKFVRVAWSQRATCLEQPSSELLLVNTSVWEPTVSEVVSVPFRSCSDAHIFLCTFRSNTSTSSPPRLDRICDATPS
jgi:hypothetical protein